MDCAFRLNGTSDLCWYRLHPGLIQDFSDCKFYDYTKYVDRLTDHRRPIGYHLTFSHDGDRNWQDCVKALRMGVNVATVFDHKQAMPSLWRGYRVIDGDQSDYRPGDNGAGCIVGLKAKGKARTDMSGFVIRDFNRVPLTVL